MRASEPPSPRASNAAALPQPTTSQHQEAASSHQPPPLVAAKAAPATAQQEVPPKEPDQANDYTSPEWWLVYVTIALCAITGWLAWYTRSLYQATVKLGEDAKSTSERQSREMNSSIAQATKSAIAMEKIAVQIEANTAAARESADSIAVVNKRNIQQLRAYIAVDFGKAHWQDANYSFGSEPVMRNNGNTPARNVCYAVNVSAFEGEPAKTILEQDGEWKESDNTIIPGQQVKFFAATKNRLPDDEAVAVFGGKKSICVWGTIKYDDVFGGKWHTNFCHIYLWAKESVTSETGEIIEKVTLAANPIFHRTHNDAT